MTAHTKTFKRAITIMVPVDIYQQFIAASYMLGRGGRFSVTCREWLSEKLEAFLAGLSPARRDDFNEILQNVRLMDATPEEVGEVIASIVTAEKS